MTALSSKSHPLGSAATSNSYSSLQTGHPGLAGTNSDQGHLLSILLCSCTLFGCPSVGQRLGAQSSSPTLSHPTLTFGWLQTALCPWLSAGYKPLLCWTPFSTHLIQLSPRAPWWCAGILMTFDSMGAVSWGRAGNAPRSKRHHIGVGNVSLGRHMIQGLLQNHTALLPSAAPRQQGSTPQTLWKTNHMFDACLYHCANHMLDHFILQRELVHWACLWLIERLNEPSSLATSYHIYSLKLLLIHITDLVSTQTQRLTRTRQLVYLSPQNILMNQSHRCRLHRNHLCHLQTESRVGREIPMLSAALPVGGSFFR